MKLTPYLIRCAIVGALGGLLFGFDTAVISGTTNALTREFHLSPFYLGITVSVALLGTVIAAMTAGIPGQRYGPRETLRVLAFLYVISAVGCAFAWNWPSLLCFRLVGGLAIGGSSVLGPVYIAEVAPAAWRGRLVGMFQVNIVIGILLAYLSNYVISSFALGNLEWRWQLGVSGIPAAFFLLLLFTIPTSPRWLAAQGRANEGRDVLKLTGSADADGEMHDIVASLEEERAVKQEPLFSHKYRLPVFLAIFIGSFNQLSGINAILYYLNDIFAAAGYSKTSGNLQAVAVGATNLVFTLLAMSLIDSFGRKKLLLIGSVGTAACLFGVSALFFAHEKSALLLWLLVGFIGFFAFSQGSVIWVYLSEIFPNSVRAKGQSLGSSSHWVMNAVVSLLFPLVAKQSGGFPFAFFGVMMVVQFFAVLFVFPETKGVTLEEMQHRLTTH